MLSGERRQSVRINRLSHRPREAIESDIKRLVEVSSVPWCPDAFFILGDKRKITESPLFREGEVYVQNASSLIPVLALDPRPGEKILDLAAAPGGKASHIASIIGNNAHLWLNDSLAARLRKLESMVQLLNVKAEHVTSVPAQYADKFIHHEFDRILLDAQCSGEGRIDLLRPNALQYWSLARVKKYGLLQQRMLVAAFKLLRPGGALVYSTCSISPEENEQPIDHLLRHYDARVVPIDIGLPPADWSGGLRAWNGRDYHADLSLGVRARPSEFLEPFFVCKLEKSRTS